MTRYPDPKISRVGKINLKIGKASQQGHYSTQFSRFRLRFGDLGVQGLRAKV